MSNLGRRSPFYGKIDSVNLSMQIRGLWNSKDKELSPITIYDLRDEDWQDITRVESKIDAQKLVVLLTEGLTKRELMILHMQFVMEMTLDEIGATQRVTKERIRQISAKAIRKCQSRHRFITNKQNSNVKEM